MASIRKSTDGITWTSIGINLTSGVGGTGYISNLVNNGKVIWANVLGGLTFTAITNNGVILSRTWGANNYNFNSVDTVYNTASNTTRLTNPTSAITVGSNAWIADPPNLVSMGTNFSPSAFSFTWTTLTSNLSTSISSLAYGNGLWLAAADSGGMRTSTDTFTWTTVTSNFGTTNINSVAYGNGLWVAVGPSGTLRTSTNGSTWNTQTSSFGTININDVAYGNGVWAIVGPSGAINTSTNGSTWVTRSSNFGVSVVNNLNSLAYSTTGRWVGNGGPGSVIRNSTDGATWGPSTSPSLLGSTVAAVTNGFIMIWGFTPNSSIYSSKAVGSTDGITWATVVWSSKTIPGSTYPNGPIIHGGGSPGTAFFANAVGSGRAWGREATSVSASSVGTVVWTSIPVGITGVAGGGKHAGRWILWNATAVGSTGIGATPRTTHFGASVSTMASNGTIALVGSYTGELRTTTDTTTWNTVTSPTTSRIMAIGWGNSSWVIGDDAGRVYSSPDANSWTTRTAHVVGKTINTIAYGNTWIIGTSVGDVITSTDGITWVTRNNTGWSGTNFLDIASISYGNGMWSIVGQNGQMRTSTDAITWTTVTSNFGTTNISFIEHNNGTWFATGNNQYRTSTDTVTWITQANRNISSITYGNNQWFAVSNTNSAVSVSTNGITWSDQTSNLGVTARSIAYNNGRWVVGGVNGSIRNSTQKTFNVNYILDNNNQNITAIGNNGLFLKYNASTNAWDDINTGINDNFVRGAVGTDGTYIVAGQNGLYRSTNSTTWTTISFPPPSTINDIMQK